MSKKPQIKKLTITLDPSQGAARMMSSAAPYGYRFVSMTRSGNKAVGTYARIDGAD